jgi:hypothetical protein
LSSRMKLKVARNEDGLNHLVQQLGLAAPEPREILPHDRKHIVLVAAGLARGIWRDEHVLHGPQRRGRGQRLLDHDVERGAPDLPALRRYADGCMRPIASASISFSVSAVSGQVRATKSARDSSAFAAIAAAARTVLSRGALGGVGWGGRLGRCRGSAVLESGEGPRRIVVRPALDESDHSLHLARQKLNHDLSAFLFLETR